MNSNISRNIVWRYWTGPLLIARIRLYIISGAFCFILSLGRSVRVLWNRHSFCITFKLSNLLLVGNKNWTIFSCHRNNNIFRFCDEKCCFKSVILSYLYYPTYIRMITWSNIALIEPLNNEIVIVMRKK